MITSLSRGPPESRSRKSARRPCQTVALESATLATCLGCAVSIHKGFNEHLLSAPQALGNGGNPLMKATMRL